MSKDFLEITNLVNSGAKDLFKLIPDVMKGFGQVGQATYKDDALSAKTKELMALAIGISLRCDGCLGHHAKSALKLGATREEIAETIAVAIQMGGGPSMVYGAEALRAYDQHVENQSTK